ncbi:MAG: cation:proton antiporter, partial [candidate division Zixibacteria bacterium]|nr:cation:proton antiporter [candidate division Zixibacteria bacterium]
AVHQVDILAEIGVILLLFTIGVEFSFKSLWEIKRLVFLGGSLQVVLTGLVSMGLMSVLGLELTEGILIGFLVALSSTAVVLKLIQERGEFYSPHGRISLGMLIFQDLSVVPMMLLIPLLAGTVGGEAGPVWLLLAKAGGLIVVMVLAARWLVPFLLNQIVRTGSRDIFLLSIIVICFSVAWATSYLGLSLALGAFLAGLMISDSEFSHQALGNIIPFKDTFVSFFFISVGMLLDVSIITGQPLLVAISTISVILVKALVVIGVILILGYPLRTAILAGLALAQVGEFSFVLAKAALGHGLLGLENYQLFLAVSVITLTATPLLIKFSPAAVQFFSRSSLPYRLLAGGYPEELKPEEIRKDHLFIIGFGVNGKNVARAAGLANIPYCAMEINPEIVRAEKAKGEPVYYGDATQPVVLERTDMPFARVVVIAITDASATRAITASSRRLNPKAYLVVRTRYLKEMDELYRLGASEVIPEEFETSIEIFSRVLDKFLVAREEIEKYTNQIRREGYEIFRIFEKIPYSIPELKSLSPDIEVYSLRVGRNCRFIGKDLLELQLPKTYGVTILAIHRGKETLVSPHVDTKLAANDVMVAIGQKEGLEQLDRVLKAV